MIKSFKLYNNIKTENYQLIFEINATKHFYFIIFIFY